MKPVLKVVIAEPSLIIRKGLLTVLKKTVDSQYRSGRSCRYAAAPSIIVVA